MALPHYKLHTPEASAAFPVLLAPTEAPPRFAVLNQIFCSRKLLIIVEIISVAAGAALLWLLLDPTITAPKPIHLLIPAITLGICLLCFVVIALVKNRAEARLSDETDQPLPMAALAVAPPKPQLPTAELQAELNLEQWSSEPFQEIMDEALIAEVFDDDLVAPDHMVFSLKFSE